MATLWVSDNSDAGDHVLFLETIVRLERIHEMETIFMNGPVRVLFLLRVLFTVWMESRRLNVFFEV